MLNRARFYFDKYAQNRGITELAINGSITLNDSLKISSSSKMLYVNNVLLIQNETIFEFGDIGPRFDILIQNAWGIQK